MSKNDGGPAFPLSVPTDFQWAEAGMTLRDWLAGQSLMGIGAWCPRDVEPGSVEWHAARAEYAYADADAMLSCRTRALEAEGRS